MSFLLSDPRVVVHIDDGFSYLTSLCASSSDDPSSLFDVIITDSSDPVGPAEALYHAPYFKLVHSALAPGGHMSSQAECMWLQLGSIKGSLEDTRSVFVMPDENGQDGQAEYAYTTVPTYPGGQIGLVVCRKAGGDQSDVKVPSRNVEGTLYYNAGMHKAAFVLPEFVKRSVTEGVDLAPKVGKQYDEQKDIKKVLLLGSGFVARPAAEYVLRDPNNSLTIGG